MYNNVKINNVNATLGEYVNSNIMWVERHSGVMVSALDSGVGSLGSSPGRGQGV